MARRGFSDAARKSAAIARRIKRQYGMAAYNEYKKTGRIPPGLFDASRPTTSKPKNPVYEPAVDYHRTNGVRNSTYAIRAAEHKLVGDIDSEEKIDAMSPEDRFAWTDYAANKYKAKATAKLKNLLAKADIRIRMPIGLLYFMAKDGKIKNQHESRTSGGFYNPASRQKTEKELWGIPAGSPPEKYPVYGYVGVAGHEEPDLARSYGYAVIKLKKKVRERTTFTSDDSLGNTALAPTLLTEPELYSFYKEDDLLKVNSVDELYATRPGRTGSIKPSVLSSVSYHAYLEAQVHGGVTLDDIEEIVLTDGEKPPREAEILLTEAGIKVRTVEGINPYP